MGIRADSLCCLSILYYNLYQIFSECARHLWDVSGNKPNQQISPSETYVFPAGEKPVNDNYNK